MREKLKVILTYTALTIFGVIIIGASIWMSNAYIRYICSSACSCN